MSGARRRGLTLAEVIVGATVGLLLLGIIVVFLTASVRVAALHTTRSSLRTSAALTAHRLAAELQQTTAAGLSLTTQPQATVAAMIPIDDVTGQGTVAWQERAVVFHWSQAGGRLIRETWAPATLPPLIPQAQLIALATQENGTETVMCDHVVLFELRGGTPLQFKLRASRHAVTGLTDETFEIAQTVYLRNK